VLPADTPGDGIDALEARRKQRRRPLPPRNPRQVPVQAVADHSSVEDPSPTPKTLEQPSDEAPPEEQHGTSRPSIKRNRRGVQEPHPEERASQPSAGEGGPDPLRLAQFYVTAEIDTFLRSVRAEAVINNLDVSASAVAREALQRLMKESTPTQLVRLLGEPKTNNNRRGRPRR
jgi:hypothetical protein